MEKKDNKIKKSYSPIKAGRFYVVTSKYFIPKKKPECFFILSNENKNFDICIKEIFLTSVIKTIWDIKFDKIYVKGGSELSLIPLNRKKFKERPENITAVSLDRNDYKPIKTVGEAKEGLYKVTQSYDTKEILKDDEIILGDSNSLCIYVRNESGVTAPVNCEVRFYLE